MDNPQFKILLVDDEPDIIEFLAYNLSKEGFKVFTAFAGKDGVELAVKEKPHLIVLDIMMPEMDGIEACRQIREHKELRNSLVAFLSARNEDYTQIAGFEVGADDYITKPIKPRVFVSRVKALLRRSASNETIQSNLEFGNIRVDKEKHLVYRGEKEINLPKKEFKLFTLLSSKPGKVFSRDYILEQIWSDEAIVGDRTIDVHIRKLREKLGEEYFKTIKGVGYKFEF